MSSNNSQNFCGKCGKPLKPGANFCAHCGTVVKSKSADKADAKAAPAQAAPAQATQNKRRPKNKSRRAAAPVAAPAAPPTAKPAPAKDPAPATSPEQAKKKKLWSMGLMGAGVVILLIAVGMLIYQLVTPPSIERVSEPEPAKEQTKKESSSDKATNIVILMR